MSFQQQITSLMKRPLQFLVMLLLASSVSPLYAAFDPVNDDTDIFLANPNNPNNRPNVLIIVDNTANWSRNVNGQAIFINEKSALYDVISNLSEEFNIGLGLYTETGSGNSGNDGMYLRYGIRQMSTTNRTVLANVVNGLDQTADKGNNNTVGLAMLESYRYYAGKTSYSSVEKAKTDFSGSAVNLAATNSLGDYPLSANTSGTTFTSPIASATCAQNFIIYISNGTANENSAALSVSQTELNSLGYDTSSTIALSPNGQQGNWMDEWADYMANADINSTGDNTPHVYTYTVEVDPVTTGGGPDMTALMKSAASKGNGKYFSVSSANAGQGITNALNSIFKEIQAVNSVFASTTLPVSVNVRGTNLNQVYIGVFRPDENKDPRWYGNLKAYSLGFDSTTSTLFLQDANGTSAENVTTGFINPSAQSYWTSNSTFWSFRDASLNGTGGSSDSPDGDLVEKGGAAEQLRIDYATSQTGRKLYTCTSGCSANDALSATPFDTSNSDITSSSLGLGTKSVDPLTAYQTSTVSELTDTRDITGLTTAAGGTTSIDSLDNNSTTLSLTSLTTSFTQSITAMDNSPVYQSISSLSRASGSCKSVITAVVNNHGFSTNDYVHISGVSATEYNGDFVITKIDANTFTYDLGSSNCNPAANPNITSAQVATTSTIVSVTVPGNSFSTCTNSCVTIAGVTPSSFNGSYNITSVSGDTFKITTSSALAPVTSVSGATAKSTNNTIAKGTYSGGPFSPALAVNDTITISGATPSGYNKTYTVASVPSASTFTVDAGSALGNASTPGSVIKGSSTVTATISGGHALSVGSTATITISGAVPNGYNGTYSVSVTDATHFTYTKAGLGPYDSGSTPSFSTGSSTQVTATVNGHGFGNAGDVVQIDVSGVVDDSSTLSVDEAAAYNGTNIAATVLDADTLSYSTVNGQSPEAVAGTYTVRLHSPTAIATLSGHGYSTGDSVIISGASPSEYNGTKTITVIDSNTFQYSLSSGPQGDASGTIEAKVKSTTATATVVAHGLTTGDTVDISGATPSAFNVTGATVTVTGNDTFTYTIASKQGDASGTIVSSTAVSANARADLIDWVRGEDNNEDENNNSSSTDVRASIHGDVLHSRPAVVNYNRFGNDNDVYIFYGSNDGIFRAVKGGFSQADSTEPTPGQEAWGFIPEEFFPYFQRLRDNAPTISSGNKKDYFMDGSLGVYVDDVNDDGEIKATDGDKVYIYLSAHRGGRIIYALDVSDPQNPKFLWKKTSTDWPELGQTWSIPFVTTINAQTDPVLIFGAGYDPLVEDVDPATITSFNTDADSDGNKEVNVGSAVYERSMGRGIFVADAFTGDLIFQASGQSASDNGAADTFLTVSGMDCSVPSDIAVITDRTGSVDNRGYFGDTCGNLWRLDMDDADPDNWTITKLATLGDTSSIAAGLRKFLFPPDVVYGTGYDAVLIGSGDREHPFDTDVVNNFYMIKDAGVGTSPTTSNVTESDLFDATSNCIQDASACSGSGDETSQSTAQTALAGADGWFITLGTGEKVVGNAVTLNNVTFFNTNQPTSGASTTCTSDLGIARQYTVTYSDATSIADKDLNGNITAADRSTVHPGGGYLPSPVPLVVVIDGEVHEGVISGVKVDQPPGSLLGARLKKFWFKEFE